MYIHKRGHQEEVTDCTQVIIVIPDLTRNIMLMIVRYLERICACEHQPHYTKIQRAKVTQLQVPRSY